jgi:hypothetical protein
MQASISSDNESGRGGKAEGLPRSMVLRGRRAFQQVRQSGRKVRMGELVLFFCRGRSIGLR